MGVTMKAIQMSEQGGPEVLQLVELPDPQPRPGEVLIKVDAAAVNFSDLMRRRGDVYPGPTRRCRSYPEPKSRALSPLSARGLRV
jgi:NADPH:quinone reductase-like Zn-dependent oxidoreductase